MGSMGIGGYYEADYSNDCDSIKRLSIAFDNGLTFIDTAEIYGAGHSEELIGKAIAGRREEIIVASKFSPENSRKDDVINAAHNSLRRLNTEYIDLYQTHWPNPSVAFEETMEGIKSLFDQGLIRYFGLSNATKKQIDLAEKTLEQGSFISIQQAFNLSDRFSEKHFLPNCQANDRIMISYSPLMEGKLLPTDKRKDEFAKISQDTGLSISQLILSWILSHDNVVVIPKATSPKHLESNIKAVEFELPADLAKKISDLYQEEIIEIHPDQIQVKGFRDKIMYTSIQEALENKRNMSPSPKELSDDFLMNEPFRPVKLKKVKDPVKPYMLTEGALRYWAWNIAFRGKKRIKSVITE
ncbi:aldo/keto reductase [Opitutales bacterium]|nr:aldo/keto reductase [Opitutales bacterium]